MKQIRAIRTAIIGAATLATVLAGASIGTSAAQAAPSDQLVKSASVHPNFGGVWTVVNGPVSYYNSPNTRDINTRGRFTNGQQIGLECYEFGGPAGQFSNTLWYMVFTNDQGYELINDHYLNTPGTAASPQPQGQPCDTAGFGNEFPSGPFYNAVGAANWSNEPNASYGTSFGFANGDTISLYCYAYGGAAGPFNNVLWYFAEDTRTQTFGWINDHNLSTPDTAANPVPEAWSCVQAADAGLGG